MRQRRIIRILIIGIISYISILVSSAAAGEVRIAVASNFLSTLNEVVSQFERDSGHRAVVSSGSSGKLYAQIKHGAPFDAFFSADSKRPQLLETEGLAVHGSRFTYAVGRLSIWSLNPRLINGDGATVLAQGQFDHIAMANPKTAPYGTAAKRVLERLGLWQKLKGRIVYGENIAQTFQFVFSNNAQLGFVALSQVLDLKIKGAGSRWDVPKNLHDSLQQQAVLLVNGKSNKAAIAFHKYVKEVKAQKIIERFGYRLE